MGFKKYLQSYLPILLVLLGLSYTFYRLSTARPDALSSDPHYVLDAQSYWEGARSMIERGDYLYTKNIYHSPGAQAFTSWIFRLSSQSSPMIVRYFNFAGFTFLLLLMFFILEQYFSRTSVLWALAFAALSPFWRGYLGTIQYEIWLCLIFTTAFYFLITPRWKSTWSKLAVISLCLALSFLVRYHFILLLPFLVLSLESRREKFLLSAMGLFLISIIAGAYLLEGVDLRMLQENSHAQLRWLTPASQGYNYPYPDHLPPAGWHYLIDHPFHYLYQLVRRFLYLFGVISDGYPNTTLLIQILFPIIKLDWRVLSNLVAGVVLLLGLWHAQKNYFKLFKIYLSLSLTIYLPILIVGATQRFLLPLYGIHYLFLGFGLMEAKGLCLKFRQHSLRSDKKIIDP